MVPKNGFGTLVARAAGSPRKTLAVLIALARGYWYRLIYPARGIDFQSGRNLRVYGSLNIRGPGRIRFGNDVVVDDVVTPWTYDRDALIEIGDRTFLNGTQFGCASRIAVGERSILARASIMDTNFHSTAINRHDPEAQVKVAPVIIGANVWIAAQVGILPGTTIGDNCVVGFGAVCAGDYPANSLVAPPIATVVRRLEP